MELRYNQLSSEENKPHIMCNFDYIRLNKLALFNASCI